MNVGSVRRADDGNGTRLRIFCFDNRGSRRLCGERVYSKHLLTIKNKLDRCVDLCVNRWDNFGAPCAGDGQAGLRTVSRRPRSTQGKPRVSLWSMQNR